MAIDLSAVTAADLSALGRQVIAENLTYLSASKLARIEACAADVVDSGVPGDLLETGVALGGGAIVLAAQAARDGRGFHGYDVFEMMPAPGAADPPKAHAVHEQMLAGKAEGIRGDTFVFYLDDLFGQVLAAFERHGVPVGDGVELHRGLVEETLHPAGPVALAHIDTDWYDPVRVSLERIWPQLSPGGYLVCDDYSTYDGARKAVDEFRDAHAAEIETLWDKVHIVLRRRPL